MRKGVTMRCEVRNAGNEAIRRAPRGEAVTLPEVVEWRNADEVQICPGEGLRDHATAGVVVRPKDTPEKGSRVDAGPREGKS